MNSLMVSVVSSSVCSYCLVFSFNGKILLLLLVRHCDSSTYSVVLMVSVYSHCLVFGVGGKMMSIAKHCDFSSYPSLMFSIVSCIGILCCMEKV